jgi:hypothetical protein
MEKKRHSSFSPTICLPPDYLIEAARAPEKSFTFFEPIDEKCK